MIRSKFPKLRIQSAEDGLEGLEKVKAFRPHVVWTCVKMPRMDGLKGIIFGKSPKEVILFFLHLMEPVSIRLLPGDTS
jgi:DNA-binding response OmpR family regulator